MRGEMGRTKVRPGRLLRSAIGLAGVVALSTGCHPKSADVSVDLDRVLKTLPSTAIASPPLPSPPKPAPAIVATTPSRPAQILQDPSHASPGFIRESIERQQAEAQRTLERRLREYYAT